MIKTYVKPLLLVAMLTIGTFYATPVAAQSATYSCGAYGGGSYSETECAAGTTGGNNTGASQDNVKPPDTGFAKLMQPANLIALIASVFAILVGFGMIFRLRKQQHRQNQ